MARPVRGAARLLAPKLDGKLGRFFLAPHAAHGDGTRQRSGFTGCTRGWVDRFWPSICPRHQMGTGFAPCGPGALPAADRECFPMELSMAPAAPGRPRALRGRIPAIVRQLDRDYGEATWRLRFRSGCRFRDRGLADWVERRTSFSVCLDDAWNRSSMGPG